MVEEDDGCFSFSEEDFERRYSPEETPGRTNPAHSAVQAKPASARLGRSRNRYMRALLRRRLAASRT
jgi:hypothetical protein